MYTIPQGVQGIAFADGEQPKTFVTTVPLVFEKEDLVFDPIQYIFHTVDERWGDLAFNGCCGFRKEEDGKEYILMVSYGFIQIGDEDVQPDESE